MADRPIAQQRLEFVKGVHGPHREFGPGTVIDRFESNVAASPLATALVCDDERLSYARLNARANGVAWSLTNLGVGPDRVVALEMQRGAATVAAMLGVLKAGGAFLPLDMEQPESRRQEMIQESRAHVVWRDCSAQERLENPPRVHDAGHLAYLMFTSGSTGKPKAVAVEHGQLWNYVNAVVELLELPPGARYACVSTFAADLGNTAIFPALCSGGELHVVSRQRAVQGPLLAEYFEAERIDLLKIVPSHLDALLQTTPRPERLIPARRLVLGGEPTHWSLLDRIHAHAPDCVVINHYGPTETTVGVATHRLTNGADRLSEWPPVGRPLANVSLYVLDEQLEPVPDAAPGELYVGGRQVSRGYLNSAIETAQGFMANPFGTGRLYRTGDLARVLPDGTLQLLGRRDHQVKIRGFRIELGEIEAKLGAIEGVGEAVVLAREDSPGEKRLVAYYTVRGATGRGAEGEAPALLDAHALREQLAAQLPEVMVPVAFVGLRAMPLTPNGKLDRKVLPAPDVHTFSEQGFEEPVGKIEATLARIWSEVLGLERIDRRANFFEVGGHSLLATQVISRVQRDLGIAQSVRAVFESPTLQGFAARLRVQLDDAKERLGEQEAPSRIAVRNVPLPTSFPQRRMWLIQQLNPHTTAYNISLALHMAGPFDADAFARGLDIVVNRHEAFRTRIEVLAGEPMQFIAEPLGAPVERIDLGHLEAAVRGAAARQMASDMVARPFDLSVAGCHRIAILRIDSQEHVFVWVMHHAIGDQWSFGILLRELRLAYSALIEGRQLQLAPLELDCADFAAWQRGRAGTPANREQLAYWRRHLDGLSPLALPIDLPRVAPQSGHGGVEQARLAPSAIERLKQLSRREAATPYMTLLACFQLLMSRLSGQDDIAVAAPIANRLGIHSESLVGTLVNTLVMRSDLSGKPSFVELLARVKEVTLQAYANQDTPFEQLVEEIAEQRDSLRAPLVQVSFNLVNAPFSLNGFPNLKIEPFALERRAAQFELAIGVDLEASGQVNLAYASDLFTQASAERFLGSFMSLVDAVLDDPSRCTAEYDLLGSTQRNELARWNATHMRKAAFSNVATLISTTAVKAAARPALQDRSTTLSYAQLEAQANRLARELRARGIARGALVGLCVDRSTAMLVALLGILKAGAAYVPLDPAYPAQRLLTMAQDAQLALLVTQSAHTPALNWPRADSLWLDADCACIEARDDTALAPDAALDAGANDPAYVIYTSGSTGTPKGVAVSHAGVLNFLASMAREPGLNAGDRLLAVTTLSFDIAVLELLLPLSVGAMVILAGAEQAQDGWALRALLEEHEPSVMQATPSRWRMLLDAGWSGASGIKALIGGEALPLDLAQQLLARTAELWNMYGPTETTVWSTCWRVMQPEAGVCIGRPIANTQVHVLDGSGRQCPIGVPGEIYIGGDGVALGYLHRPELTAERFLPDALRAVTETGGARWYRTGDLGRWRYDGQLEHLGRLDHQVKIRGHRVELGEIEANLGSHAGVARVLVIAREDRPGDPRIVAYLVPRGAMPPAGELRDHLRATLPQYMLPQHFIHIDAIPLLPNGKLDRAKLPKPGETPEETRSSPAALETALEHGIAQVWRRLLNIDGVGRADNFFDLGGHSLLAMRAVSEIEQSLGLNLSPRRLIFETLAQLAATPEEATAQPPVGVKARPLRGKWLKRLKRLLGAEIA
ncbi:MAG: amino acid adenylation domain-containing protein [Burkholderiaceae bacterium]